MRRIYEPSNDAWWRRKEPLIQEDDGEGRNEVECKCKGKARRAAGVNAACV